MLDFFEALLEIIPGFLFEYIFSPFFKLTTVVIRWILNFGKVKFIDIWDKPNNAYYGFLIWIGIIITTMLYYIFKK